MRKQRNMGITAGAESPLVMFKACAIELEYFKPDTHSHWKLFTPTLRQPSSSLYPKNPLGLNPILIKHFKKLVLQLINDHIPARPDHHLFAFRANRSTVDQQLVPEIAALSATLQKILHFLANRQRKLCSEE